MAVTLTVTQMQRLIELNAPEDILDCSLIIVNSAMIFKKKKQNW